MAAIFSSRGLMCSTFEHRVDIAVLSAEFLGDGLALTFGDRLNQSLEGVALPSCLQTLLWLHFQPNPRRPLQPEPGRGHAPEQLADMLQNSCWTTVQM